MPVYCMVDPYSTLHFTLFFPMEILRLEIIYEFNMESKKMEDTKWWEKINVCLKARSMSEYLNTVNPV